MASLLRATILAAAASLAACSAPDQPDFDHPLCIGIMPQSAVVEKPVTTGTAADRPVR